MATYLKDHWKEIQIEPVIVCSSDEAKERLSKNFSNTITLMDYAKGFYRVLLNKKTIQYFRGLLKNFFLSFLKSINFRN